MLFDTKICTMSSPAKSESNPYAWCRGEELSKVYRESYEANVEESKGESLLHRNMCKVCTEQCVIMLEPSSGTSAGKRVLMPDETQGFVIGQRRQTSSSPSHGSCRLRARMAVIMGSMRAVGHSASVGSASHASAIACLIAWGGALIVPKNVLCGRSER